MQNDAKPLEMTETQAHGFSSESYQRHLSNEYQHDTVKIFFKNICILVLWTKAASAMEKAKETGMLFRERHCNNSK